MAHIEFLATELITHIFDSLESVQDVVNLASTCSRMNAIYNSTPQLRFLSNAAERQYGPLTDAIQLLTQNSSQPAHVLRSVNNSLALIQQLVRIGNVACQWANLYPYKKWKENYIDRRLLSNEEQYKVRRAIYRIWLYGTAFHSQSSSRGMRLIPHIVAERSELLRNWTTCELAEITDVRNVIRDTLASNVCPSNATITRKFRARHGDDAVGNLVFNMTNIHLNFPPPQLVDRTTCIPAGLLYGHYAAPPPTSMFHESRNFSNSTTRTKTYHLSRYSTGDAGGEGWGDYLDHYYTVEDLMKLNPKQILWLKEQKMSKASVLQWIRDLGEWFGNNGDTFGETLSLILDERDISGDEFWELEGIIAIPEEDD